MGLCWRGLTGVQILGVFLLDEGGVGGGRLIRKFLSEEDVEKKDLISARQKESFLLIHDQWGEKGFEKKGKRGMNWGNARIFVRVYGCILILMLTEIFRVSDLVFVNLSLKFSYLARFC